MDWEDARWMLRKLAALSEPQILQALLATPMTAAEVRLALEKLLGSRQKMLADFGLSGEFPEIAARRIDRTLDFDPSRPGDLEAVSIRRHDGTRVVPAAGDLRVRGGHLVTRAGLPPPQRAGSASISSPALTAAGEGPSGPTTSTGATKR
jgi:hypothetical protein